VAIRVRFCTGSRGAKYRATVLKKAVRYVSWLGGAHVWRRDAEKPRVSLTKAIPKWRAAADEDGHLLFRRAAMMLQPTTRSNQQIYERQRFCTTPFAGATVFSRSPSRDPASL
jgi:hypothetical protein